MARDGASGSPFGGGDLLHHVAQQLFDAEAGLAADSEHILGPAADQAGELLRVLLGVGRREVDLVQHGNDVEVVLQGQIQVREGLRLDALRRIHQQDGTLAGGERTAHLVREVDVTGSVDHVERVRPAVQLPRHAHGLALDGDPAFTLDVHAVEVLRAHVAVRDHAGDLQHAVGERRFAVIDVSDDAEVANQLRRGRGRLEGLVGAR